MGPSLAPYQPAQRYFVLDERRVQADDLPRRNRMSAVIALEQSRSPRDVARVADMLAAWLPAPLQVRRAFADWMRQIVERLVPSGVELPPIRKLEDVSMTLVETSGRVVQRVAEEGLQQGLATIGHQHWARARARSRYERCCAEIFMTAWRASVVATAERLAELLACPSPTRSVWPTSAIGLCSATPAPTSSPASRGAARELIRACAKSACSRTGTAYGVPCV